MPKNFRRISASRLPDVPGAVAPKLIGVGHLITSSIVFGPSVLRIKQTRRSSETLPMNAKRRKSTLIRSGSEIACMISDELKVLMTTSSGGLFKVAITDRSDPAPGMF
jgi:hypothetical protein